MTSADGPSRAGPISDRVVKPEALKSYVRASRRNDAQAAPTLVRDQRRTKPALASTKKRACWAFQTP